ncbi:L-threonylcarbamoyladenylate synthase [Wolbachia endosymbiont of Howardula sp.]|uniref:L-threonylcarbamoyladenylate synthase n=1 Tax=Wolbachia endosymbiont of Howardula sp. TaxID=2916816 RepID=UPI00217E387B|nr:L-threonylcarbamoyladenylate synthase [Wolbachia endosymbiont of Howardula sp.]UWI83017.1 threonylcarbamoyl-AMP synthase [Wolbachia endosymbiont of Howardula sp.]
MISQIVQSLHNDLLVCFPTETVYALSCHAYSNTAIAKIYQIKNRVRDKKLSIFVHDIHHLQKIANIKEEYMHYINYFSPGPVTYIVPLKNNQLFSKEFFQDNIGIRIPNHPVARLILQHINSPIVATSINMSGTASVYTANTIPKCIKQYLSIVIEDDRLVSGIDSTIIDLTGSEIKIVRQGAISLQDIRDAHLYSRYKDA